MRRPIHAPPPFIPLRPHVIERPDGFYWQDQERGVEYGPFATLVEALADIESDPTSVKDIEPGESLLEAEEELGIADWIDPDTGDPAEESVPHIEDR